MSLIYSSGTPFTTPTTIQSWVEYPFRNEGDVTTKVYHHVMQVDEASYAPLADDVVMTDADAKPARSPFADDGNAYFAGDYGLSPIGNGLVTFDRQFANIPQERTEANGFYPFQFPAIDIGIFLEATTTSKNATYIGIGLTFVFTLSSTDAEQFNLGDTISIKSPNGWSYRLYLSGTNRQFSEFSGTITAKSGTVFTVERDWFFWLNGSKTFYYGFGDNGSTSWIIKKQLIPKRNSTKQDNSPSIRTFRYIKTNNPESVDLEDSFTLLNATGEEVDTISSTTNPNRQFYADQIIAKNYLINAEPEFIQRWKNNIYEISTIKVLPK